jgi:serine/threonine protein kinase
LCEKEPGILDFVTEAIAERFDSRRLSAERRIGKYITTEAIGSGGYSIVFKGYHHSLGLPVAIKMLRHNLALRPAFQENFWNEAKTIAKFHHENIIRVYDLEEMYRTIFIIMELVQGENLKDMLLRLGSIPPLLACNFLDQIAAGLEYAHAQGILHLDVNPSNMLVQAGEKIKIMDFGMACPSGVDDRGICDGTVFYMAPEQIEVETIDERTDIYSLGISAYELLTGKHPFPNEDVSEVMQAHLSQNLPDPAREKPALPAELRGILLRACRKDPASRYQNMGEFRRELQEVIRKLEGAQAYSGDQDPLDILGREHALIRQFLDNLAIAVESLQGGRKPARELFETAIKFSKMFTGRYHHFKEEQVLFCRLTLKEPDLQSQIQTLQYQHERGREIMANLAQNLKGYQRGQEGQVQSMIRDISAYISLLRQHIHEEEHVLYPLIRKTFLKDEMQAAQEIFQQEENRHGGGMHQAGQEMIQEMGKFLARNGL